VTDLLTVADHQIEPGVWEADAPVGSFTAGFLPVGSIRLTVFSPRFTTAINEGPAAAADTNVDTIRTNVAHRRPGIWHPILTFIEEQT
jgi:hypothetical protein